ncbi:acyl-CoA thioesterase [Saccharopolyspora sp. K220]|uniref:acyl-CoA thioesterase n=1 Tax=Saccharopolyspora soli TaxID=2926618 RepID=UPI001F59139E|nr:acyl-CoA thioesterase [Saccharopolyspora soli]MCI2418714.1 acyl-CoA thioesterase [Saccharopolyspora soli]
MSTFSVQLTVRQYETDFNGHVNHVVYFDWADHARIEYLRRAGLVVETFLANKTAPVILQAEIRYLRELRAGEDVTVTCEPSYGEGKTFTMHHGFIRNDGTVAAELQQVMGILDHPTRRLVPNPHQVLRALATQPDLLEPTKTP